MNFMSFIIKFIKFKPIIKFKKFELHNYGERDLSNTSHCSCNSVAQWHKTSILDLLTVGPKFSRPACYMKPTMRIARDCTALPLSQVQTDGRTNRRTPWCGSVSIRSQHTQSAKKNVVVDDKLFWPAECQVSSKNPQQQISLKYTHQSLLYSIDWRVKRCYRRAQNSRMTQMYASCHVALSPGVDSGKPSETDQDAWILDDIIRSQSAVSTTNRGLIRISALLPVCQLLLCSSAINTWHMKHCVFSVMKPHQNHWRPLCELAPMLC